MKAAFWRNTWWHLRYPGLPADAAPQAVERRVVTADEAAGLGLVEDPYDIAHDSEAKRIVRVLMMGSGLNEYGATAIRDAYLAEATRATVPVPGDALRGLVEVARYVAPGWPLGREDRAAYPDAKARNALAALYKARLIDRLGEDSDA